MPVPFILTPQGGDTFNRANENPLDPTNWTAQSLDTMQIISDRCVAGFGTNDDCRERYLTAPSSGDQYCQVTVNSLQSTGQPYVELLARITVGAPPTFYRFFIENTSGSSFTANIFGVNVGTLYTGACTFTPGDTWALACVGNQIQIVQNGTVIAQVTDTTYTSGLVGLGLSTGTNAVIPGLSNFVFGSAEILPTISGNVGIAGATVSWTGTSSGSTTADGSGNYTTSGLANGNYTITPSLSGHSFTPPNQAVTVAGSNITGINFSVSAGQGWSPVDSRDFGGFPNSGIVQPSGAIFYDQSVPPTCNADGLPVDSRASVPADSRVSAPINSRANQD